jgi:hypothetical protein
MRKVLFASFCFALLLFYPAAFAQNIVVFSDTGFPVADSASPQQLSSLIPGARAASADQLSGLLAAPTTALLVLPYGSAFPEQAWTDIHQFLQRGGNLLVLGGRPFSRSAFHDNSGWHLRDYNIRFMRALMIDQYQETPGSDGAEFQTNPDMPLQLPRFGWKRAFSPIIRLSAVDLYKRGGAAGSIDARVDTLAWGVKDGRKMSAPAVVVDHLRNGFDGGRWVFLNADLSSDFYSGTGAGIVRSLADLALQGSHEFTARPVLPLYLSGEPVQLNLQWQAAAGAQSGLTVKIATYPEAQSSSKSETKVNLTSSQQVNLPAPSSKGLYLIDATLMQGEKVRAIYHTGFWIRDEEYLKSGPRLTVNKDYFELDGKPLAVVGTTYMSSEVQRLYFEYPNVYVWNRELGDINNAGLNMVRTGWWTGWDKFCNENGEPYERTYRTLEAYLMTARKFGLPIQFNFFAFLPDVLGGVNPYLDPAAVRRQRMLISSIVTRFHDVPWLAWDFINEPSISQYLWKMVPNGDPIELQKWNEWLNKRYPDKAALAAAWNVPASSVQGTISLPESIEFTPRGGYVGRNSLKVYDFFVFAQEVFVNWVNTMREAVRASGSQQLVTVGQDEGGIQDRLSPAYWGPSVSFTTNHSWWQNDYVVWDSLLAKQPGETLLIQETGLQRELNLDEIVRRNPDAEASLLERKVAASFIQGAGAIEWLWNTNSYMTESNETPIGLIRPDGTEKPEATTMRAFAAFSKSLQGHLRNPQLPAIAIVTSQAAQFSVLGDMQLEAQRTAVRALTYQDHLAAYAVAENQIAKLGSPKLVILPSAQALTDAAWHALLQYANDGGNLLVTGPVDRDEHWHVVARVAEMRLGAVTEPLMFHSASLRLEDRSVALSFDQQKQNFIETLRFRDGSSLKELPYGKGRIFWAAYPVEMAQGTQPAADLYMNVASKLGITPAYETVSPLAPGVLVYPTILDDSVMYVMISDSAEDYKIDFRDKLTGTQLTLQLSSQHAAIAVIGKKEKTVVAKFGF